MFKSIGELLREERYRQSLTQIEAAERCGLCRSQYQKYEYDILIPKIPNCRKIAKGMRIEEEKLLRMRAESYF